MLDPEEHKEKAARNRAASPEILTRAGITFITKNDGAHLIVSDSGETFDFWPGTGKYIRRRPGQRYKRGVFNLIKDIQSIQRNNANGNNTRSCD